MALHYFVRDADGNIVELDNRVRKMTLNVTENAEEGSVAISQLELDDPNMDLNVGAMRIFKVYEDTASAEFVYIGYTANREIIRDEPGTGRRWLLSLADINSILPRRVLTTGAKRDEETDVERVTWVESTSAGSLIDDTTYLLTDDPEDMDEADYRGQFTFDVLRDCAEQAGKNFYVTHFLSGDGSAGEGGTFSLWYGKPAADEYESTARLTNVAADVTSTTFIVVSAKLLLNPDRVYSGIYLPFKKSYVYVEREQTRTKFARRDAVMPAPNVKTKARATARANRYAEDAKTEAERITAVVRVPLADIHLIRPGMVIDCKFLHLPGYDSSYVAMRVLNRQVTQPNLRQFELTLELAPTEPTTVAPAEPVYGILYVGFGPRNTEYGSNLLYHANPGDTPGPGYEYRPTTGRITPLEDTTPPSGNGRWYGWRVDGTGTIDVEMYATTVGVMVSGSYTIHYSIRKNGAVVTSGTSIKTGHLQGMTDSKLLTATISVVPDDVITAVVWCSPAMPFFRAPAGTGQNGNRLEITGGSLS